MVTIVNSTWTFSLSTTLDLYQLNQLLENSHYKAPLSRGRNSLRYQHRSPRFTALIHSTGKVIIIGIKSVCGGQAAANIVLRKITKYGYLSAKISDLLLRNIVMAGTFGFRINRDSLYQELVKAHRLFPRFDPERFAGLCINFADYGNLCLTVFGSGKFQLTGSNDEKLMKRALDIIRPFAEKQKPSRSLELEAELNRYLKYEEDCDDEINKCFNEILQDLKMPLFSI